MHPLRSPLALAAAVCATLGPMPAHAQVAGATTTVEASVTETTRIAMGWSVKKTLLGKTVYNEAGKKVGEVEDLIVAPDRNVSYVIVGAGGFIGIGRHDVAIPVTQIQDKAGRLVMAGATPETIKALPEFTYADDTTRRDQFVAAADKDIASGKARVAELEQKASGATAEARSRIDVQITALQSDLKSAEARLTEMKQATAVRWREFEAGVTAATTRLRRSVETAVG